MITSPLVRECLAELRSTATNRLEAIRSQELVEEIRDHIAAAVEDGHETADVLRRLGSPAEIVAAEATDAVPAPPQPRLRAQEVLAIILLLVGLPLIGVGWVVGVVLLWMSDRWSTRDKLIGTLLLPGGLGALLVAHVFARPSLSAVEECDATGACTTVGSAMPGTPWWVIGLVVSALVIVPVLTSIHLFRSAKVPQRR